MILYHGTMSRNIDQIRWEGLRMKREIPDEPSLAARVCLSTDYDEAMEWGDGTVVVVDVPDKWVRVKGYQEMSERQVHHNIPSAMIVRIDEPAKPIRIAFLARVGGKLRIPKTPMTEPVKIAFLGRLKKPKLRHTEEVRREEDKR